MEVVYEDNQGNVGKAVGIWQKFDKVDRVSVVISCFTPMSKPLRENAAASELQVRPPHPKRCHLYNVSDNHRLLH